MFAFLANTQLTGSSETATESPDSEEGEEEENARADLRPLASQRGGLPPVT